jgi:hypothetical protein
LVYPEKKSTRESPPGHEGFDRRLSNGKFPLCPAQLAGQLAGQLDHWIELNDGKSQSIELNFLEIEV